MRRWQERKVRQKRLNSREEGILKKAEKTEEKVKERVTETEAKRE